MNALARFTVAVAAGCLVACGGGGSPQSATPAAPATSAPAPAPPAAAPVRDVATLKACEIVTPSEVAGIVGGKLLNEPPAGFSNCAYVVETAAATESYRLLFAEPGMYAALLQTQSDAEKGERLDGLWDEAYVQAGADGSGFTVIAIKRGDIALEAKGDRKEPAVEIARRAASRVN
jgi:hypothetical protein